MRQTPTPSLAPTPPKHASIHWAPFSADTKVSRASFHQWVQSVPTLAESSICWDEATRTGDDRIDVIIQNDNQESSFFRPVQTTPPNQETNPPTSCPYQPRTQEPVLPLKGRRTTRGPKGTFWSLTFLGTLQEIFLQETIETLDQQWSRSC